MAVLFKAKRFEDFTQQVIVVKGLHEIHTLLDSICEIGLAQVFAAII